MITRPTKLQDPDKVREIVNNYFAKRLNEQEVRELKNGDKRIYRTPPSIWSLARELGISYKTFWEYVDNERNDQIDSMNTEALREIRNTLADAKERIIQELYEGVCLGYWNERVVMAQLARFGVIGTEESHEVKVVIQGNNDWSK